MTGGQALNLTQTVAATDAQITVDGITITKSTNSISDVIDGVTLELKKINESAVTVTADSDIDGIIASINEFVSAYNESIPLSKRSSPTTQRPKAPECSRVTLPCATCRLECRAYSVKGVENSYTTFGVIGQIGLSFNNDGSLGVDSTKLQSKLEDNLKSVAALLLGDGADSGVLVNLQSALKALPILSPARFITQPMASTATLK
ncbi:MAG: flagellar filament capping protein FliD [Comamonadaceae bacterium]|nr:flagellar filament capping protein FliD [Comamonadaceae bacterium]